MSIVAPKFLARRQEPAPPALPPADQHRPQAVVDFLAETDRTRQECAYLRSELDQTASDLRVEKEKNRLLEEELTHVRNERDWLTRHDSAMLATLDDVEALIVARKRRARAEAYAPPATGQQDTTQQGDELAAGVAEIAKKFSPPEKATNEQG